MAFQIMSELFDLRKIEYNIRPQTDFSLGAVCTTNYGLQSIRYFAQKNWNMIPADIKNVNNLSDFTLKVQPWIFDACPCNLCRCYVSLCNNCRTL